jgi:battenin
MVVGMADSGGVTAAGFVSLVLEPLLCAYQVNDGRPWCRMT